ncbi:MAG: hypothetical protein H6684_16350 [Deltaproteobacteria bacterium]|nr:hypothetical protein [bacterium]MCB9475799.1 hypothetical protein [Deltaproteobacteria bacterium]MCB9490304.1 hypothetical protein [Deltaproteobacteria bacterium]
MVDLKKTAAGGTIGFLGGALFEQGIESVLGVDFVNGVCEIAGAVAGMAYVNREMVDAAYRQIKMYTGKEPAEITEAEWLAFKLDHPNTAKYLEEALRI